MSDTLTLGREAFLQQRWAEARARFALADNARPLDVHDLERFATSAYLTGDVAESVDVLARAHRECLQLADEARAARCAFWIGFQLMNQGERARGSGWIARASRLIEDGQLDCAERGYVLLPVGLQRLGEGDAARAREAFEEVGAIGDRFGDRDLTTLGCLGRGQALIRAGEIRRGVLLLDEAMVAIEAGEVSQIVAGIVYCAVIEACRQIFDLRRAQEWTAMMSQWCAQQPDLVPFRGQCLIWRAEILQLHGEWSDAFDEALQACDRLSEQRGETAAGAAFYQMAELHRLRGQFAEAEKAYEQASRLGRKPQPGLALLRLVQGQTAAAEAAIRRVLDEARTPIAKANALPAYVEIMLASGDLESAHRGVTELGALADEIDAPLLTAAAAQAQGSESLAEGDAPAAIEALRRAWTAWDRIEAPYEAARVRALLGRAYGELGDEDTARMELDAARCVFEQLDARPDLQSVLLLIDRVDEGREGRLTARELEVLRLVAAGNTNRAIGETLYISERTVERHVSNIFNKLGVSSRSAATAHAYEHHLL